MIEKRLFRISLASALLTAVILASPLSAQVDKAAINGTVTDASGAAVSGATIALFSTATGLHRNAETDAAGIYHFPALPIGHYKLTVSKEGFSSVEFPNVELSVGQPRTIDVRLEIGAISS